MKTIPPLIHDSLKSEMNLELTLPDFFHKEKAMSALVTGRGVPEGRPGRRCFRGIMRSLFDLRAWDPWDKKCCSRIETIL